MTRPKPNYALYTLLTHAFALVAVGLSIEGPASLGALGIAIVLFVACLFMGRGGKPGT